MSDAGLLSAWFLCMGLYLAGVTAYLARPFSPEAGVKRDS